MTTKRCDYAGHEWIARRDSPNEAICARCDKYRIEPETTAAATNRGTETEKLTIRYKLFSHNEGLQIATAEADTDEHGGLFDLRITFHAAALASLPEYLKPAMAKARAWASVVDFYYTSPAWMRDAYPVVYDEESCIEIHKHARQSQQQQPQAPRTEKILCSR